MVSYQFCIFIKKTKQLLLRPDYTHKIFPDQRQRYNLMLFVLTAIDY